MCFVAIFVYKPGERDFRGAVSNDKKGIVREIKEEKVDRSVAASGNVNERTLSADVGREKRQTMGREYAAACLTSG